MRVDRVLVYKAKDGWRWRFIAKNNRIMADGAEAYSRKFDCQKAATQALTIMSSGVVEVITEA